MPVRRRDFITLVGGAAVAWPLAARAQPDKLPTVGFLGPDAANWIAWTTAFAGRLSELGWIEGRTVAINYRWSEGASKRVAEIASEFVQQKVDVIVTYGGAVTTIRQATTVIPIVFALSNDPLGGGLVASLSRPGGNATGLSIQSADTVGKRVELLRDIVPQLRRLAVLVDAGYPAAVKESSQVQATARPLGLDIALHEIRSADDVAPALEALRSQSDALYIVENALIAPNLTRIVRFAIGARLPTSFITSDYVRAGGLMSYGPSYPALFRRAAEMVDKILHGAKPADIPVEQPSKFEFVINMKTAKALGLTVPYSTQLIADEVIE
jgi:putative tryptophan/tyrosine transport system substrate-binding protein